MVMAPGRNRFTQGRIVLILRFKVVDLVERADGQSCAPPERRERICGQISHSERGFQASLRDIPHGSTTRRSPTSLPNSQRSRGAAAFCWSANLPGPLQKLTRVEELLN